MLDASLRLYLVCHAHKGMLVSVCRQQLLHILCCRSYLHFNLVIPDACGDTHAFNPMCIGTSCQALCMAAEQLWLHHLASFVPLVLQTRSSSSSSPLCGGGCSALNFKKWVVLS